MQVEQLIDNILNELSNTLHQIDVTQIEELETSIIKANRIFVAGKGRTGLQMKAFAMRLMHLGLKVFVVDDVTTPGIQQSDLLIIGSGSGRTESLNGYAKSALSNNADLAFITGNAQSPITNLSHNTVYIPASNFKSDNQGKKSSALIMGSLFEYTIGLLFDLMIIQLMNKLQQTEGAMNNRHANLE
ncbi:6-phospho-3-hexuloisomerase [Seonamhaeicola sp.]|uniref:6-phospho-3-hexuloisomerase n=1 Tax=Seonamhaeicola sp. TaxID=1912245 RepID=UPI002617469B|nr:6-phospho-3-hexuloisomerase [Seonamhaeicola sp.]